MLGNIRLDKFGFLWMVVMHRLLAISCFLENNKCIKKTNSKCVLKQTYFV